MKFSKSILALVLVGASVAAPIANAQDNLMQSIVSRVLSSAVEVTIGELQQQANQSVANAAHQVSVETVEVATKVKVTELTAEQISADLHSEAKSDS